MASDKTVILVTGATGGIGYETVAALSAASSDFHVLLGSRSVEKGEKALADLQSTYGQSLKSSISVIQLDVCDQQSIQSAKAEIDTKFGKLDVLINNAGIIVYQQVDQLTMLRQTFETNVFAQQIVTETLEPLLQKSANPYVIYITSEMGSVTKRLDPTFKFDKIRGEPYRMSKSALNMLAACHRHNYADWCKVLAFNPGWCVSNLSGPQGREMRKKGGARDPKEPALVLADVVLGKRDEDIAKNGMVDVDGGVLPW
ncbi:putative short chain dehydrogenase/reductase [Talaromyces proteolyticus]|uniref:Short chain dehydrogenase/reductase n=1 Tax=Talaromyces proteolyticus TaxID=1131652 RepID=A0AAD4L040_9EURO|nr:putative short chain dehydrogenase/reductase [Talaromyces proteolyticus]KAH8701040.1 putative short chain dehydrogenase/reductase [Talaromyces proteolyticus]